MIVDCHTQVWDNSSQMAALAVPEEGRALLADTARHLHAVDPVDHAFVLGFKSRYLSAEISNEFVADYVNRYATKMIGFAGIDPTDPTCLDDVKRAHEDLQLKGVVLAPAMQNFHPFDTQALSIYDECVRRGLPVVFEQNHRSPSAKLEFSRPLLIDEVAREFPDLRIMITHLGYPWVEEAVAVLGKHQHVYADVAVLLRRPWLAYRSLLAAYEYGVLDKLLFGSDFPYRSPATCIEALYTINQVSYGTNLVTIPREQLRGIVERDALSLLGIPQQVARARPQTTILSDDD